MMMSKTHKVVFHQSVQHINRNHHTALGHIVNINRTSRKINTEIETFCF